MDIGRKVNQIFSKHPKIRIRIMEDVSEIPEFSTSKVNGNTTRTHEVNLLLESAALRSLTCAFWVALY